MPKQLKPHPLAEIFPPMDDEAFAKLVSDMKDNGQREPITTHEGKILDGIHRYKACVKLGLKPKTRKFSGSGSLVAFVLSANLHRRHLDVSQRSMIAAKIAVLPDGQKKVGKFADLPTQAEAAEIVGVSERSVRDAVTVEQSGIAKVSKAVSEGEMAVSQAAAIAALPTASQVKVMRAVERGESPREAVKKYTEPDEDNSDPKEPWTDFNSEVTSIMSDLRSASRKLVKLFGSDAAGKRLSAKYAHFYSYSGTIGGINAVVKSLGDNMPTAKDSKSPGFIPARVKLMRESR